MIETRELSILFNGEMVRAIREGRKTQTRRVIKPQPESQLIFCEQLGFSAWEDPNLNLDEGRQRCCPYGVVGDRLWVREHWGYLGCSSKMCGGEDEVNEARVIYHADDSRREVRFDSFDEMMRQTPKQNIRLPKGFDELDELDKEVIYNDLITKWWKSKKSIPSIHMPRWASRLAPVVTDVRVQRVQDISAEDAIAEGVMPEQNSLAHKGGHEQLVLDFKYLWDSINKKRGFGWDVNPWVWAVTFKVEK